MDNLCHTLVGIACTEAGLKKKTALATATAAISANLPDIDVLVFMTDVPSVAFRRGITHGVPAQILLPLACAGIMWLLARRRSRAGSPPASLGWLLAIAYVGIFTHVGLDFLNTYGIRLLAPLSQRWFYGDAVFIIDLWLWLMLGAGVLLARRWGPRFARVALVTASIYVGGMLVSARIAREIVHDAWVSRTGASPAALMVGPVPASVVRKNIIVDTGPAYVTGHFRWFPTRVTFEDDAIPKNDSAPGVAQARTDPDVRGVLIWSRFPVWETRTTDLGIEVRLRDMRFRSAPTRGGFSATTIVPPAASLQPPASSDQLPAGSAEESKGRSR